MCLGVAPIEDVAVLEEVKSERGDEYSERQDDCR
jgi:hypothetical protein